MIWMEATRRSRADDLVALLQRMIRIPTVNPPGECYEAFVADFESVLDELGYTTEVHRVADRARAARPGTRART